MALEWHRNTLTDTNESGLRFMEQVNHRNLYSLWQPTVALDMQQRVDGIDLLGDRLLNLHIYYWPEQGIRCPLEEGVDKWKQYLAHVDSDKDRFGLLEFVMDDAEEQLKADAKVLHRILSEQ